MRIRSGDPFFSREKVLRKHNWLQPSRTEFNSRSPCHYSQEARNAGVLIGLENRDDSEMGRGSSILSASAKNHTTPGEPLFPMRERGMRGRPP